MEARCPAGALAPSCARDPSVPTPAALLAAPFPSIVRGWFLLEQRMRLCFESLERTRFFADFCEHSCGRACRALCVALPCLRSICLAGGPSCSAADRAGSRDALAPRVVSPQPHLPPIPCTMLASCSAGVSYAGLHFLPILQAALEVVGVRKYSSSQPAGYASSTS